ncbi:MAG: LysM peptidoglycan-binding domain-containing protein, partial [Saprospiraceae bacterium]|nr:LysM peptidoglycan-binding domain-containing protein [Saprospiraceae bacterium]
GGDQYYVVVKEKSRGSGVLHFVTTASAIKINGDRVEYATRNLSFSFNFNQTRNGQNIADGTSNSGVFFMGNNTAECKTSFSFSVTSGTDITILPEIGVTEYKTTFANNGNALGTRKLTTINGTALNAVLRDLCANTSYNPSANNSTRDNNNSVDSYTEYETGPIQNGSSSSKYTTIADYNTRTGSYQPTYTDTEYYEKGENTNANNLPRTANNSIHIVRAKETLYGIAKQYGVTVQQLKDWNSLSDTNIHPSDRLVIKQTAQTNLQEQETSSTSTSTPLWEITDGYHTKKSGETIRAIAQLYGFTEARFRYINALTINEEVPTGYRLKTTDCVPETTTMARNNRRTSVVMDDDFNSRGNTNLDTDFRTSVITPPPYSSNDARNVNYAGTNIKTKTYIVRENDTLYSIAKRYNTTVQQLVTINNFDSANEILIPDQTILVP